MIVNLEFQALRQTTHTTETDLVFGQDVVTPEIPDSDGVIRATFPQLAAHGVLNYSANVLRKFGVEMPANFDSTRHSGRVINSNHFNSLPLKETETVPWGVGIELRAGVNLPHKQLLPEKQSSSILWGESLKTDGVDYLTQYVQLLPAKVLILSPWQLMGGVSSPELVTQYVQLLPTRYAIFVPWRGVTHLNRLVYAKLKPSIKLKSGWFLPWQRAKRPSSGHAVIAVIPPHIGYTPSPDINFICKNVKMLPREVLLNFGVDCHTPPVIIPIRKVYFIVNEVHLTRVSDNQEIQILSASISTDKGSWCWSFDASVPYSQLSLVDPQDAPVEVELTINGTAFRALVESYETVETFGKRTVSIKGRSITALLDTPYAHERAYLEPAQIYTRQFCENELLRTDVVQGYALEWSLVDDLGWLVPENTISYQQSSPVKAMKKVIEDGGGYLNSHPSQAKFLVKPLYPFAPWEWGSIAVDKQLPIDVVTSYKHRWASKPTYNSVIVTGELVGVQCLVKRAGTAGDLSAPMFSSPLITSTGVARVKGMSILAAGGKQAIETLEMPLLGDVGVIYPNELIEVTRDGSGAWRGLVSSTSLNVSRDKDGGIKVVQANELERFYG